MSGRAGTGTVCVTAPDVTDVTSLGVRASDGGSIYRPPHEDRYTTLDHLDTEEQILTTAGQAMPQAVTEAQARAAVTATGLNAEQADAVVRMLTATTAATALIAPAGAGKSHTMAAFAGLWELLTGRRVIGLTTSTNAARVLAGEGLAESYNIAEFLGKVEGSDELRRPVPVHDGDVLVIDEATQASTADLAMLLEAARVAGARVVLVGDTQQLGSPEAGGMFRLLAAEVPAAELTEVRRFHAEWEADASIRLRAGEPGVIAVYDRHGRIRAADQETAYERAAGAWLADHLRGKDTLLLAGSNEEAADLARRVQARLIQAGKVGTPGGYQSQAPLADGNQAHPGDLIRARLNTEIDAGGQKLTNRDTLKITAIRGPGAEVRRQKPDGTWTEPFWVPRSYLAASAELGYAGNVHVAQGRTVDTAHLLVTESLSRQVPVRRDEPRPRNQHRPRRHRQHRTNRQAALPAGHPRIRAHQRHAARRRRAVRHRSHPAIPGMGQRNRAPPQPLDHRRPRPPSTPRSTSTSPPHSPRTRPHGTSRNTPARPSTRHCAPPASPGTTSAPSLPRSPALPSTAPGPSPASSTDASSASTSPARPASTPRGPSGPPPAPPPPPGKSPKGSTPASPSSATATRPAPSRG